MKLSDSGKYFITFVISLFIASGISGDLYVVMGTVVFYLGMTYAVYVTGDDVRKRDIRRCFFKD
jgi:hypothetical protein